MWNCGDGVSTDTWKMDLTLTFLWVFSISCEPFGECFGRRSSYCQYFATNTAFSFYRIWLDWQIVFAAYSFVLLRLTQSPFALILSFQIVSSFSSPPMSLPLTPDHMCKAIPRGNKLWIPLIKLAWQLCEKQWIQYGTLMVTNLDAELVTELTIQTHTGSTVLIHCLNYKYYPFHTANSPRIPLVTHPGSWSKAFSESTKVKYKGLCLPKCFSRNWSRMKIASVVLQHGIKPTCTLLISTWYLIADLKSLSMIFITWPSIFEPLSNYLERAHHL